MQTTTTQTWRTFTKKIGAQTHMDDNGGVVRVHVSLQIYTARLSLATQGFGLYVVLRTTQTTAWLFTCLAYIRVCDVQTNRGTSHVRIRFVLYVHIWPILMRLFRHGQTRAPERTCFFHFYFTGSFVHREHQRVLYGASNFTNKTYSQFITTLFCDAAC
jgi:hypothetical protein